MPAYRLYMLDGVGKITNAVWVAADADEDALREADRLVDGASFELWERQRLIGRRKSGVT